MSVNRLAFTLKAKKGLLRVLVTNVRVHLPNSQTDFKEIKAIWDTGASASVITKQVATNLGLKETGMTQVHTANGTAIQKTYTVDIGLPNNVIIQGVTVTEADALSTGCDCLIGMDIINLGDLSITNHNGCTCMTFRVPSSHEIDYVKNPNFGVTPIITQKKPISRNAPCYCGSGKQYKRCHGQSSS